MRSYQFVNGPWENSELPTIVKDDPAGGDPHILAVIKRVHNPDALYELCRLANDQVEVTHETGLTPRQLAERCKELEAALESIVDLTKPGQTVNVSQATDIICDVWNAARAAMAKAGGAA